MPHLIPRLLSLLCAVSLCLATAAIADDPTTTPASAVASATPAEYSNEVHVTKLLRTTVTATGQPIEYVKTDKPLVTTVLVEIPPGKETGWHIHKMPCYAYVLSGKLTVEIEGGKTLTYEAGQAIAETVNTPHNGKNNGTEPVKIVMTVIGERGVPIAEKLAKPPAEKQN